MTRARSPHGAPSVSLVSNDDVDHIRSLPWAPAGYPQGSLNHIYLVLLHRAWSRMHVQAIDNTTVNNTFKAWVLGLSPSALAKDSKRLTPTSRNKFQAPRTREKHAA